MRHLKAIKTGAIVFFIVVVGVIGIFWAVSAQWNQTADASTQVVGETQTADVGNWTALGAPSDARSFADTETITNASGTELQEGADYRFNASSGEVYYYNTDAVSDGESMTVDYTYYYPSSTAKSFFGVIETALSISLPVTILIVLAMTMVGLGSGMVVFWRRWNRGGSRTFSRR